jgi:hypothetical protein
VAIAALLAAAVLLATGHPWAALILAVLGIGLIVWKFTRKER